MTKPKSIPTYKLLKPIIADYSMPEDEFSEDQDEPYIYEFNSACRTLIERMLNNSISLSELYNDLEDLRSWILESNALPLWKFVFGLKSLIIAADNTGYKLFLIKYYHEFSKLFGDRPGNGANLDLLDAVEENDCEDDMSDEYPDLESRRRVYHSLRYYETNIHKRLYRALDKIDEIPYEMADPKLNKNVTYKQIITPSAPTFISSLFSGFTRYSSHFIIFLNLFGYVATSAVEQVKESSDNYVTTSQSAGDTLYALDWQSKIQRTLSGDYELTPAYQKIPALSGNNLPSDFLGKVYFSLQTRNYERAANFIRQHLMQYPYNLVAKVLLRDLIIYNGVREYTDGEGVAMSEAILSAGIEDEEMSFKIATSIISSFLSNLHNFVSISPVEISIFDMDNFPIRCNPIQAKPYLENAARSADPKLRLRALKFLYHLGLNSLIPMRYTELSALHSRYLTEIAKQGRGNDREAKLLQADRLAFEFNHSFVNPERSNDILTNLRYGLRVAAYKFAEGSSARIYLMNLAEMQEDDTHMMVFGYQLYSDGVLVAENDEKAIGFINLAAERGNDLALSVLSKILIESNNPASITTGISIAKQSFKKGAVRGAEALIEYYVNIGKHDAALKTLISLLNNHIALNDRQAESTLKGLREKFTVIVQKSLNKAGVANHMSRAEVERNAYLGAMMGRILDHADKPEFLFRCLFLFDVKDYFPVIKSNSILLKERKHLSELISKNNYEIYDKIIEEAKSEVIQQSVAEDKNFTNALLDISFNLRVYPVHELEQENYPGLAKFVSFSKKCIGVINSVLEMKEEAHVLILKMIALTNIREYHRALSFAKLKYHHFIEDKTSSRDFHSCLLHMLEHPIGADMTREVNQLLDKVEKEFPGLVQYRDTPWQRARESDYTIYAGLAVGTAGILLGTYLFGKTRNRKPNRRRKTPQTETITQVQESQPVKARRKKKQLDPETVEQRAREAEARMVAELEEKEKRARAKQLEEKKELDERIDGLKKSFASHVSIEAIVTVSKDIETLLNTIKYYEFYVTYLQDNYQSDKKFNSMYVSLNTKNASRQQKVELLQAEFKQALSDVQSEMTAFTNNLSNTIEDTKDLNKAMQVKENLRTALVDLNKKYVSQLHAIDNKPFDGLLDEFIKKSGHNTLFNNADEKAKAHAQAELDKYLKAEKDKAAMETDASNINATQSGSEESTSTVSSQLNVSQPESTLPHPEVEENVPTEAIVKNTLNDGDDIDMAPPLDNDPAELMLKVNEAEKQAAEEALFESNEQKETTTVVNDSVQFVPPTDAEVEHALILTHRQPVETIHQKAETSTTIPLPNISFDYAHIKNIYESFHVMFATVLRDFDAGNISHDVALLSLHHLCIRLTLMLTFFDKSEENKVAHFRNLLVHYYDLMYRPDDESMLLFVRGFCRSYQPFLRQSFDENALFMQLQHYVAAKEQENVSGVNNLGSEILFEKNLTIINNIIADHNRNAFDFENDQIKISAIIMAFCHIGEHARKLAVYAPEIYDRKRSQIVKLGEMLDIQFKEPEIGFLKFIQNCRLNLRRKISHEADAIACSKTTMSEQIDVDRVVFQKLVNEAVKYDRKFLAEFFLKLKPVLQKYAEVSKENARNDSRFYLRKEGKPITNVVPQVITFNPNN